MRRPWFPFYTGDWQGNANLRRCSHAERGAWIDVLCLMHDSEEYGVLRWALREIADAIGCRPALLRGLVSKSVIKGADPGEFVTPALVFIPVSGRRSGPAVTLVDVQPGPLWYSSRMVLDGHRRRQRAGIVDEAGREPERPPGPSPKGGFGEGVGEGFSAHPTLHPSRARASDIRYQNQISEEKPHSVVIGGGNDPDDCDAKTPPPPADFGIQQGRSFAMRRGWEPGPQFGERLDHANLPLSESAWRAELGEFVQFRAATGEKKTQGVWEHVFIRDLQFKLAQRAGHTSMAASGTLEQLTDRSWAAGMVPDPTRRLE